VLRHYDPKLPIKVETDASRFAAAAVLSQKFEDGHWHPVAFWSRKFNDAELNYGTPDQEMLGIVEAFKHWRQYLDGAQHPILVLTGHRNLEGFMKPPKLNGRQARWCLYLSSFDFTIKHQPGKRNPADGPSRRPDYNERELVRQEILAALQQKMAHVRQLGVAWREADPRAQSPRAVTGCVPERERSLDAGSPKSGLAGDEEWTFPLQYITRTYARACAAREPRLEDAPLEPLHALITRMQAKDGETQLLLQRVQAQNGGRPRARRPPVDPV
jgi:hypothetical protein